MSDECTPAQIETAARAREWELSALRGIAITVLPCGGVAMAIMAFLVPPWAIWLLALLCGAIGALASLLAVYSYALYCVDEIAATPVAFARDHVPQAFQILGTGPAFPGFTPAPSPTGGRDLSWRLWLPILVASGIAPLLLTGRATAIGGTLGSIVLGLVPFAVTLVLTSFLDAFMWSRVGRVVLSRRTGIDSAEAMRREGFRSTWRAGWQK